MNMIKLRLNWFWQAQRRRYYTLIHGIKFGPGNSILPVLGKGRYVSVYRKGSYLDVVRESDGSFVRLIPYQPNHGIMAEYWKNGKCVSRHAVDYKNFISGAITFQEVPANDR